jgi:hypothetical protein
MQGFFVQKLHGFFFAFVVIIRKIDYFSTNDEEEDEKFP